MISKTIVMSSQADGYEREDYSKLTDWQQRIDVSNVNTLKYFSINCICVSCEFSSCYYSRDLVSTMVSTVCFNFLLFGSKLGHSRILDSLWSELRRCSGVPI